jgi:hypothetical protein
LSGFISRFWTLWPTVFSFTFIGNETFMGFAGRTRREFEGCGRSTLSKAEDLYGLAFL